jgi:CO/xanthine dehydrogenase FAD-binding subunit
MSIRVGSYLPWEPIRRGCAMLDEERRIKEFLYDEGEVTSATVDAQEDIHASAAYRRSLAGTMVERALRSAAA